MTVRLADDGTILLIGDCPAGDAEPLLQYLLAAPTAAVDWSSCQIAHTAVVQVLLAAGRNPRGQPQGKFLKTVIGPAFGRIRR